MHVCAWVGLAATDVVDVSALSSLVNLRSLDLGDTAVRAVEPLSSLPLEVRMGVCAGLRTPMR